MVDDNPREISKGLTGIGTSLEGGFAGEAVGASIGTAIFPGVGTVIGGLIGGLVGAAGANHAGGAIVDVLHDEFGNDICNYCKEMKKLSPGEIQKLITEFER